MRRIALFVALSLLVNPVLAERIKLGALVRKVDPRAPIRTAAQNYRDRRFFATDNSVHTSPWQAIKRSVRPIDMQANVKAAMAQRFHWTRLIGAVVAPASIEIQRQITSGEGFSAGKMMAAVDPKVMATTMAGGVVGEVGGAMVQSGLAKFGPLGALAGFVARPLISFGASMTGYNVGKNLGKGSLRDALADGIREIEPGRDLGQIAGYTIGAVLLQALIPIPVLSGIIGGTIGGLIGGTIGNILAKGPLKGVSDWMKRGLSRFADWIQGKKDKPKPVAAKPAGLPVPHGGTVAAPGHLSMLGVSSGR